MARSGVKGGSEISAALRGISGGISPRVVQQAHAAGLKPMQEAAQQHFSSNGSMKTGVIPADIAIVPTGPMSTSLAMTGMGAKLGHMIELGTAPHDQPNRGRVHPGAQPKPFMRPAFDEQSEATLRAAGGVYGAELTRIARALKK